MTFTRDELFLALVGLVHETNPAMLHQDAGGFTVDFDSVAAKENPNDDDRLLLKMRAALETPEDVPLALALDPAEGTRLAAALARLESLQSWPSDVLEISRALRARLAAPPPD